MLNTDQLPDLIAHLEREVAADRAGAAGTLFQAQTDDMRKRLLQSLENSPTLLKATKLKTPHTTRRCTDTPHRPGCHKYFYDVILQKNVFGISLVNLCRCFRWYTHHAVTGSQKKAFVKHEMICTNTCTEPTGCACPSAHEVPAGPKRRSLEEAASPSAFQLIITSQQAQQATLARTGVQSAALAAPPAAPAAVVVAPPAVLDATAVPAAPLAAPSENTVLTVASAEPPAAVAAPPADAAMPAGFVALPAAPAAQFAGSVHVDVSQAALQLRMLEVLAMLQQGQAAMLQELRSRDPAQQTGRQAAQRRGKRALLGDEQQLIDHLTQCMRGERSRRKRGLMPPVAAGGRVRAAVERLAQRSPDALDSDEEPSGSDAYAYGSHSDE